MTDPQTKERLLRWYKMMQKSAPKIWNVVAPRMIKKHKDKTALDIVNNRV